MYHLILVKLNVNNHIFQVLARHFISFTPSYYVSLKEHIHGGWSDGLLILGYNSRHSILPNSVKL